ncbi:M20/M25/M40 family metallo-hydrolase [Sphingomonas sp. LaA6.9]|uniref:M20/M25/M40 family metallo-hydrolase n=1 Tax=Sphingomonas sp. LaA6.9 TaxID=2919914 RepID=UPI001F4F6C4F|nr:M20/M25/M40 family metallo-hydrolase [Sphingomonas sp. LaA6.9]MCJ8156413.1 M20/M25/M40 family metallo-hydrolase [Sphingomonas sp. LaA6.9]
MTKAYRTGTALVLGLALAAGASQPAHAKPASAVQATEAKDMLKKGVGFRTVEGQGQVPAYAAYLASVLKAAGYADSDIEITPMGETATLVATLKGATREKPIVLLGHMDVVEAKAADWTRDPFTAVEENGYVFGRGAEDNKYDVTMMVATMARLKKEGFKPKRDIVLALSGDEETSMLTTRALAQKFKGAGMALNGDGGGGLLDEAGKPLFYGLQAGEKSYADFEVAITDAGGHSSAPTPTNPIYRLSRALDRLAAYKFPNLANELTKASLTAASKQVGGELGAAMARYATNPADSAAAEIIASKPEYVGQIRTTCVATMVSGGHAQNALPQRATANINCRIFPGTSIDTIKAELAKVMADDSAKITVLDDPTASDASPLRPDVMNAVTRAVRARYPGIAVTPSMSAGATDSLHFRAQGVPSYGVASLFMRAEDGYAHGLNERVPVDTIGDALGQWHSVLTELGSK